MKKLFLFGLILSLILGFAGISYASVDSLYEAAVIGIKGDAKVDTKGDGTWISPWVGMKLMTGAVIKTASDSWVEIVYDAEGLNVLKIKENTQITVGDSIAKLAGGSVLANFPNLAPGSSFSVRTPSAVCAVRGSGLGVDYIQGMTVAKAFEDKVYVQGLDARGNPVGKEVIIPEGWKAAVAKGGKIEPPEELSENEQKIWDAWIAVVGPPTDEEDARKKLKDQQEEAMEPDPKDLDDIRKEEEKPPVSPSH